MKEKTFANEKGSPEPVATPASEREQKSSQGATPAQDAEPRGPMQGQNSVIDAARAGHPAALRGIHSMGPGAAMEALHPQASTDKSDQSRPQAAPVYEPIDPGITAQFKAATGEDVAEVLIAENPALEQEGKRGVALEGERIEVAPGLRSDAKLCTHELVHVVQQRGPAKSADPHVKAPTDPETEAVMGAQAITSGKPFEIKVSSSEARLYDGGSKCDLQQDTGGGEPCNPDPISNIKQSCENVGMEPAIEAESHSAIEVGETCIGTETRQRILQHMMQLQCIRSGLQAYLDLQSTDVYFIDEHKEKLNIYIDAISEALVASEQMLKAAEEACAQGYGEYEKDVKASEEAPKALSEGDELLEASGVAAGAVLHMASKFPLPMPQVKMGVVVVSAALVAAPFAVKTIIDMMNDSRPVLQPYLSKSVALSSRALQLCRDIILQIKPMDMLIPIELEEILKNIDLDKIREQLEPKVEPEPTAEKKEDPHPNPEPPPEPPTPEPPPENLWLLGLVSLVGGIAVDSLLTLSQTLGGRAGGHYEDHPGYVVMSELKDNDSSEVSEETANLEESASEEIVDSCQLSENQNEESNKDGEPCEVKPCNKFGIVAPTDALEEMTLFERIESYSLPKPKSDSPISEGTIVEPQEEVIFTGRGISYYNVNVYSDQQCTGSIDVRIFLEQPRPLKNDAPILPNDPSNEEICSDLKSNAQYDLNGHRINGQTPYPQKYKKFEGSPYLGDPKQSDVIQGTISNCPLMASLRSLAGYRNGEIIKKILPDNVKDGKFTVHLMEYYDGTWVGQTSVEVDAYLVVDPDTEQRLYATLQRPGPEYGHEGKIGDPIWPALIEKAIAQSFGGNFEHLNWGDNRCLDNNGKRDSEHTEYSDNYLRMLTENAVCTFYFDERDPGFIEYLDSNYSPEDKTAVVVKTATLNEALDFYKENSNDLNSLSDEDKKRRMKIFEIRFQQLQEFHKLVSQHRYSVTSYTGNRFTLSNPWGGYHPENVIQETFMGNSDPKKSIETNMRLFTVAEIYCPDEK